MPLVHADPLRISQVLLNLLSNAVKFTPEGGRVAVECRADPGSACVTVRTRAPACPEEEQELIFQPFRQGREQGRPEGWGLGLALSASLVQGARRPDLGRVGARAGAAFTFTLPIWFE